MESSHSHVGFITLFPRNIVRVRVRCVELWSEILRAIHFGFSKFERNGQRTYSEPLILGAFFEQARQSFNFKLILLLCLNFFHAIWKLLIFQFPWCMSLWAWTFPLLVVWFPIIVTKCFLFEIAKTLMKVLWMLPWMLSIEALACGSYDLVFHKCLTIHLECFIHGFFKLCFSMLFLMQKLSHKLVKSG